MTENPDADAEVTLEDLLLMGVSPMLAIEALASTSLDRDQRVQTHSLRDTQRRATEQ